MGVTLGMTGWYKNDAIALSSFEIGCGVVCGRRKKFKKSIEDFYGNLLNGGKDRQYNEGNQW